MSEPAHSIRIAAKRSGLTPHVIRVWEKRYGAVTPDRTETNRRLYSSEEIERLSLLRQVTSAGHTISHVATLPTEALQELARKDGEAARSTIPPAVETKPAATFVEEALAAVARLDGVALENLLHRASLELGQSALLQEVLVPLIHRIGDSWQSGKLKVAHEHVATAVIRTFLGNFARPYALTENAPVIVVTTPAGQLHELGAILVAAAANNHGWRVTYLGPSLPAEEIAGAALQNNARAVALSVVYPQDDPHLREELKRLRQLLSPEVALLIGGRAAPCYADSIAEIGAQVLESIPEVYSALETLRETKPRRKPPA